MRRSIDHDTICTFRTKFKEPLKQLFKQVGRVAMTMGLVKLVEVAFDGTRVKANASRFHTWTVEKVEAALKELEEKVERMSEEADKADAADAVLFGEGESNLPPELADAKKRQEKLREAEAARKKDGIDPKKNPAQLPKADEDPKVMPNGYEPLRDQMHAKLETEEGRKTYNRRMHIGEPPFAIIKGIMEVRRFLLRGLEKVRTEWMWVCTAYNLKKMIAVLAAMRAENEKMAAGMRS